VVLDIHLPFSTTSKNELVSESSLGGVFLSKSTYKDIFNVNSSMPPIFIARLKAEKALND